ncbi:hypothetical protein ACWCYY_20450 [Kitasatospora sp. NPDC001664]
MTGHQDTPRDAVPGGPAADAPPATTPVDAPPPPPPVPAVEPTRDPAPAHRLPTVWTRATGALAALATLGHLLSAALTPWQPSVRPLPLALLAAGAAATASWVAASWFALAAPSPAPSPRSPWPRAARHAVVAGLSVGAALSLFAPFGPTAARVCLGLALLAAAITLVGSRVHRSRTRLAPVNRELRLLTTAYLAAWPTAWSAYQLLFPGDGPLPVLTRLGQLLLVPSVGAIVLTGLLTLGTAVHGLVRRLLGHDN